MGVLQGFAMALADSVPGVSGGTIAFLLGFYDRFINALHSIVGKNLESRKAALRFLLVLGVGWCLGMVLAMTLLAGFLEQYIYPISSAFLGFVLTSIPVVAWKEKRALQEHPRALVLAFVGFLVVFAVVRFSTQTVFELNLAKITWLSGLILFLAAAVSASAMILPGISGSSLLMAFGLYLPVITQLGALTHGDLSAFPAVALFALGALTGLVLFVRILKKALERYRAQVLYVVLGMMSASLYAVIQGPTTLDVPCEALCFSTFSVPGFAVGCVIIAGIALLELNHEKQEKKADG